MPPLNPDLLIQRVSRSIPAFDRAEAVLFPFLDNDHNLYSIECAHEEARRLCIALLDPPRRDAKKIYGIADDFPGFLRQQGGKILKEGFSYVDIRWPSESDDSSQAQADVDAPHPTIPLLVPFFSAGVEPLRHQRGKPKYRISPQRAHWWGSMSETASAEPYMRTSEEMIILSAPGAREGVPPLVAFVDDVQREEIAAQSMLAALHAQIIPDNHSLRVEAARYRSGRKSDYTREQKIANLRIYDRAGASLLEYATVWATSEPTLTEYFLAWQHIDSRKRLTRLRDAILDQFASQVLSRTLVRNGLPGAVKLRANGFLTEEELDMLFLEYEAGNISIDEL